MTKHDFRFTPQDHERMKEALDSLSDNPTEAEAEIALQACGTSGKEVVNEFIERLLRENLELKQELARRAAVAGPQGVIELLSASLLHPESAEGYVRQAIEMLSDAAATSPTPAESASKTQAGEVSAAPKCGKCGYVMCQQFDSHPVNAIADIATPNGKYLCYHCEPTKILPTNRCLDCGHGEGTDEAGRCCFMFIASDPSQVVDTSPTNQCPHYCPRSIGERITRIHLPFHDYDQPLSKPGQRLAADIDSAIQQVREQWIGYSRGLTGDTMGEL